MASQGIVQTSPWSGRSLPLLVRVRSVGRAHDLIHEGLHILDRRIQLNVVRRPDDQPASLPNCPKPLADLLPDVILRAERQGLLLVDRPPEAELFPVLIL